MVQPWKKPHCPMPVSSLIRGVMNRSFAPLGLKSTWLKSTRLPPCYPTLCETKDQEKEQGIAGLTNPRKDRTLSCPQRNVVWTKRLWSRFLL